MKRIGLFLGLLALAGAVFGQEARPSMGGFLGYTFDAQYYKEVGPMAGYTEKLEYTTTENYFKLGGFFDYTFVEASLALGIQGGPTHLHSLVSLTGGPGSTSQTFDSDTDTQLLNLDLRVLGKYPFKEGNSAIFPLAGLEYSFNLNAKDKDKLTDTQKAQLNHLFLDFGAGFDYPISEGLYFRAEGLYGLNLTPANQSIKDLASQLGFTYSDFGYRLNLVAAIGCNL